MEYDKKAGIRSERRDFAPGEAEADRHRTSAIFMDMAGGLNGMLGAPLALRIIATVIAIKATDSIEIAGLLVVSVHRDTKEKKVEAMISIEFFQPGAFKKGAQERVPYPEPRMMMFRADEMLILENAPPYSDYVDGIFRQMISSAKEIKKALAQPGAAEAAIAEHEREMAAP